MSTPDPLNPEQIPITPVEPTDAQVELELDAEEGLTPEPVVDGVPQPKKVGGVQKRINELTAEKHEARQERDYWRQLAMSNAQPTQPQATQVAAPVVASKPEVGNFETYEGYLEALADFKADQKIKEVENRYAMQQVEQQRMQLAQTFAQRESKAKEQYADYDVIAKNPNLPITEGMAGIIANSEKGPDMAYYLGTHPEEAARIAQLNPNYAAYELGRIEATLGRQVSQKAVTRAPQPIPGVGSGTSDAPMDTLPTDEWMRRRNEQVRAKNQAQLQGRQIVRK